MTDVAYRGNADWYGDWFSVTDRETLILIAADGSGDERAQQLAERICRLLDASAGTTEEVTR